MLRLIKIIKIAFSSAWLVAWGSNIWSSPLAAEPLSPAASDKYPQNLQCQEVLCVYQTLCRDLQDFRVTDIRSSQGPRLGYQTGKITNGTSLNQIVFDFTDGDQIQKLTFVTSEWEALGQKQIDQIQGLAEDRFEWTDGEHLRSMILVRCRLP